MTSDKGGLSDREGGEDERETEGRREEGVRE